MEFDNKMFFATILTIYKFETILMRIVHFFGIFAYLILTLEYKY